MKNKFWQIISNSIKDHFGKDSLSRISSYFILVVIILNSLVYVSIDLINAISEWKKPTGSSYIIPMNHILIFSLILAHHLVLLGLKKSTDKMILGKDSLAFGVDGVNQANTNVIDEEPAEEPVAPVVTTTDSTTQTKSDD